MLKALQSKGYLYFGRDSISGFFIRLIERAGLPETVIEIPIAGKVGSHGEVLEFPQKHGHFATLLVGAEPRNVFALMVIEDIPQASLLTQDLLICDVGKKPQPGDICLAPLGDRTFLIRVASKTFDANTPSLEMAQEYPIPESLSRKELRQKLHWYPLAYDENSHDYFEAIMAEQELPIGPMIQDFAVATILRLTRSLAF
jgi:hypothetical protein